MVEQRGVRPLIVRLRNFVGDAVLGLPALRLLERHGYQLQLVGKDWAPDLFASEGWPVHVRPKKLVDRVKQLRGLRAEARRLDPGYVMVCPFANDTIELVDKTWPHFPACAERLAASGQQVLICPGPNEVEGGRRMYPTALRLEGVGQGVYNALLARARLVVSNDTGPAHMAAAVGAPLLRASLA